MSRFARITEDPEYEIETDEDFEYDEEQGQRVFDRLVEELSPHETINS